MIKSLAQLDFSESIYFPANANSSFQTARTKRGQGDTPGPKATVEELRTIKITGCMSGKSKLSNCAEVKHVKLFAKYNTWQGESRRMSH
jgi:hypothetical protein